MANLQPEIILHDFYDRDMAVTFTDTGHEGAGLRIGVNADPSSPGQSVYISDRSARALIAWLSRHYLGSK